MTYTIEVDDRVVGELEQMAKDGGYSDVQKMVQEMFWVGTHAASSHFKLAIGILLDHERRAAQSKPPEAALIVLPSQTIATPSGS